MAHLALLLPNLDAGGAERVTLTLAAEFVAGGDQVDVVVLRREGALLDQVPAGARLIALDAPRLRHAARPLARYLARERPDALLASMWPLTSIAVWAARRSGTRVVVVEHNTLSVESRGWRRGARALLRPTLRWGHRRAAGCVAVSLGAARDLAQLSGLADHQVAAIHNPIPLPAPVPPGDRPDWGGSGRRFLTVARLKGQKNHPLLVEAFARIAGTQDRLAIVGEGAGLAAIQRTAAALGIADQLILPGHVADPGPWYASADLFVLSSDFEGFANVVAEALGHGLTVVSTDCPHGPAEILAGLGRLAPVGDPVALAAAMTSALAAPDDPATARKRAATFAPAPIAHRYRALLVGDEA